MTIDSKFLKILRPCSEKFDEMTPIDRECKHCDICNTKVFDTTKISYRKFLKLLSDPNKKTCFKFKKTDKGYIKFAPSLSSSVYNLGCTLFIYFCAVQNLYAQESKSPTLIPPPNYESATLGRVDTTILLIFNLIEGRSGAFIMILFGLSGILTTVFALIKKKSRLFALGVVFITLGILFFIARTLVSMFFSVTEGI